MGLLANHLSTQISTPVIDRTGLSGNFDVVLDFFPPNRSPALPSGPTRITDTPYPPLGKALEEQLGFKLESGTGPVSILIVDSAEMPEPN